MTPSSGGYIINTAILTAQWKFIKCSTHTLVKLRLPKLNKVKISCSVLLSADLICVALYE